MRDHRRSSAGFAGAAIPGGRFRKGGEAPLRAHWAQEQVAKALKGQLKVG
jgi:hypothetical protein